MNKVIEYIIGAKDATAHAINSALNRIKSFAASVGSNLMNIKAGFDMVSGVVQRFAGVFATAIKEAFKFEKATSDFKVLLGSIDKAKEHIADLRRFASSTPLTFDDLSRASKLLLSFGADVSDVMPSMKMLGDIAMGDSQKFQGLALVFAQVKSAGKLMGQDLLQMINQGFNPLTVIAQKTGKSIGELKDMMAEGSISFEMVAEAMRVATSEGGLFNNAMGEAAQTGEGLMSTLQDKWTDAVREFGEAFADTAKGGIQELIDRLTDLVESGQITVWAEKTADALGTVRDSVKYVTDLFGGLWKVVKSTVGVTMAFGAGADEAYSNGEGFFGQIKAGGRAAMQMWNDTWHPQVDQQEVEHEEEVRQQARERLAEKAEQREMANEEKKAASLAEMMAKAEEEANRKAAENEAIEAEKFAREAAKEEERARIEAERAIAVERERLQRKSLEEYRAGLEAAQSAEADAQAALAVAQSNEAQAWGWYRDKNSLKAQIEEEKANAAAEVQFEKDFSHLKRFRKSWRTADNLSLDEEAVRRVGLAREQREAAEDYARQTAEDTARAADALEEISNTLNEGSEE